MLECFVTKYAEMYYMSELNNNGILIQNFPFALEAVHVPFQQSNRLGHTQIIRLKTEVSVRVNRIAKSFTNHYPGSVTDLTIIGNRLKLHRTRLVKLEEEEEEHFKGAKYPHQWVSLMEKGY